MSDQKTQLKQIFVSLLCRNLTSSCPFDFMKSIRHLAGLHEREQVEILEDFASKVSCSFAVSFVLTPTLRRVRLRNLSDGLELCFSYFPETEESSIEAHQPQFPDLDFPVDYAWYQLSHFVLGTKR